MTDLLNAIKKHGALGVLAMWLWFTNTRVEKLEAKLYDCYEQQAISNSVSMPLQKDEIEIIAVLPKELKYDFKRLRKQTPTS